MKKKLLFWIISVSVLVNLCLAAYASDFYTDHSHTTVIFEENSCFDEAQRMLIENHLNGEESVVTPYGLACTLFGHKYELEYVTAIRHNIFSESPRCVEELYEVSICTRCSDIQTVLVTSERIVCCP